MFRRKYCPGARAKEELGVWGVSRDAQSRRQWTANPTFVDDDGRTHLHLGVLQYSVNEGLFESAMQANCGVNNADKNGWTPLHMAARKGLLSCVATLLKNGALVDAQDKEGMTSLMYASHGHPAAVKLLIKQGANVNQSNSRGELALHYSCAGGHEDCTQLLLKHKSKPNYPDNAGNTPLILACKSNVVDSVRIVHALLDAGARPNKVDNMGRSALHWVAMIGDQHMAQALVDSGASLDDVDKRFSTPFLYAVMGNHAGVLKLLVDAGCDRTTIDGLNGTALTLAALRGHTDSVRILLEAGEDPNEFSYFGMTALMAAVYESHYDVAETLLKHGADVNMVSRVGFTALFAVLVHITDGNVVTRHRLITLLLQYGVDVNMRIGCATLYTTITNGKNCPMSFAITSGYTSIVAMLLEAGSDINPNEIQDIVSTDTTIAMFEMSSILKIIREFKCNPLSLKSICRFNIRHKLKPNVHAKLGRLPLPESMCKYLNFSDLKAISPEQALTKFVQPETVLRILDIKPCGLASLEGSLLYRQVNEDVRMAAKPGPCQCNTCVRIATLLDSTIK